MGGQLVLWDETPVIGWMVQVFVTCKRNADGENDLVNESQACCVYIGDTCTTLLQYCISLILLYFSYSTNSYIIDYQWSV